MWKVTLRHSQKMTRSVTSGVHFSVLRELRKRTRGLLSANDLKKLGGLGGAAKHTRKKLTVHYTEAPNTDPSGRELFPRVANYSLEWFSSKRCEIEKGAVNICPLHQ